MNNAITQLLEGWNTGDDYARGQLIEELYPELKAIAAHAMRSERITQSLQPTALVNEAYMKLVDVRRIDWQGRSHFIAVASQIMRQLIVDHARKRRAAKRDWGHRVTFTGSLLSSETDEFDVLALDAALVELSEINRSMVQVVELRFFGGLTVEEAAAALSMSAPTVKRRWRAARAWLLDRLAQGD